MININRKTFSLFSILLLVLTAGCGTTSESGQTAPTASTPQATASDATSPSASPQVTASNVPPVMPAPNNAASAEGAPQTGAGNGVMPSAPTPTPGSAARRAPVNQKNPPPITAGANDFYLFTAVRGALTNDAELKTANIVADVRNGAVALSGTITDPKQKSRAEQVVRGVQGVKTVTTSKLRVAAATQQ